jgi:hypothetical protein
MTLAPFEQISSLLTVGSICSPMGPDLPAHCTAEDLFEMTLEEGLDPLNHPSRVIGLDGRVIGVVWFEDYGTIEATENKELTVQDVMTRLEPDQLLSSATTVLEAVELFATKENRYYYVIDRNVISGIISYNDLFSPLGRLAFLALALEIEDSALKLCRGPDVAEKCWLSISDSRKRKAIDLFQVRHRRKPRLDERVRALISDEAVREMTDLPQALSDQNTSIAIFGQSDRSDASLLVECTHLADKAIMLWKQRLVPSATRADLLGFFNRLKAIRDKCAHPSEEGTIIPMGELAGFVDSATRIRASLQESMKAGRS